jgi:hypothetical protein
LVDIIVPMKVLRRYLETVKEDFSPVLLVAEHRALMYEEFNNARLVSKAVEKLDYKSVCGWFDSIRHFIHAPMAGVADVRSTLRKKPESEAAARADQTDGEARTGDAEPAQVPSGPIAHTLGDLSPSSGCAASST